MLTALIAAAAFHFAPVNHWDGPPRDEARYEQRGLGHEWHELREARERFYARPHSWWQERRFERWYAMRERELRHERYERSERWER